MVNCKRLSQLSREGDEVTLGPGWRGQQADVWDCSLQGGLWQCGEGRQAGSPVLDTLEIIKDVAE